MDWSQTTGLGTTFGPRPDARLIAVVFKCICTSWWYCSIIQYLHISETHFYCNIWDFLFNLNYDATIKWINIVFNFFFSFSGSPPVIFPVTHDDQHQHGRTSHCVDSNPGWIKSIQMSCVLAAHILKIRGVTANLERPPSFGTNVNTSSDLEPYMS